MNKYTLSKRLTMVADMIEGSECLADVGCDHGFLAIYLLNSKRINRAICTDINEGPLQRAKLHIKDCGFEDKVTLLLSDGLCKLNEGEYVDSCAICGMGGLMGVKILFDSDSRFRKMKFFVLQLQSDLNLVRLYLDTMGYSVIAENITFEEGKYYTAMKVIPKSSANGTFETLEEIVAYLKNKSDLLSLNDAVDFYYPFYKEENYEIYKEFLSFMINKYTDFIDGMKETSKGFDEAVRNLQIMKAAQKKYAAKE